MSKSSSMNSVVLPKNSMNTEEDTPIEIDLTQSSFNIFEDKYPVISLIDDVIAPEPTPSNPRNVPSQSRYPLRPPADNKTTSVVIESPKEPSVLTPSHCELPEIALSTKRDEATRRFKDGRYSAAHLKLHMNPTSIPILDSTEDGILHVIVGWEPAHVLSDLCYGYIPWGKWDSKLCGFLLKPFLMRKRGYKCGGVKACPILLKTKESFQHGTEDEWAALQAEVSDERKNIEVMELMNARNVFVSITNPNAQFCNARKSSSEPGSTGAKCDGGPAIRQVHATGEWFIGCSKYHSNPTSKPRHYFLSIRHFTDKARDYLQQMITQKRAIAIPGDVCEYVAVKKGRGVKRCATHGVELVEYGTNNSVNGRCGAQVILMEQIGRGDGENGSTTTPVTFAMCIGTHNHPPPPQPDSTEKKNQIFRSFVEKSPQTTPAVLRLQTQSTIQRGSSSLMGNLRLSKNVMYNTVRDVRRRMQQDQFSSMFELLGTSGTRYVRDMRTVKDGYVFLMATDEMLSHAIRGMFFAGDATFKTVMEKNPHATISKWYLYNIVTPLDPTTPTRKGVVVCRALMTVLTTEAYTELWSMFLNKVKCHQADKLGLHRNEISLNVPYMEIEPTRRGNAVNVKSVTTDFEVAEMEGIAAAFSDQRGGSQDVHMTHLMIGCRVHFQRAYLRKASTLRDTDKCEFIDACRKLREAKETEDADFQLARIDNIDPSWSAWVSRAHIRPLVSPAYSKMAPADRMFALDDTNIVESQNRLGNLICGTALDPVACAQRFEELDKVSWSPTCVGDSTVKQKMPKTRTRNGSTLQPSGSQTTRGNAAPSRQRTPRAEGRGKKRKAQEKQKGVSNGRKKTKDRLSSELIIVDDDPAPLDTVKQRETKEIIQAESMTWLHNDLSMRCKKAVQEGKEKLRIALSHLYCSVIECSGIDKVKQYLLETMKSDGAEKEVFEEFAEILVLISNKHGMRDASRQQDMETSHTKAENIERSVSTTQRRAHQEDGKSLPCTDVVDLV